MDTSLQELIQAVLTARASLMDPPDHVLEAQAQQRQAEKVISRHLEAPKLAVAAYSQARRQIFLDWAKGEGRGYCSKGKHLAPLSSLEGLITTGAYVTSGYYEYLRDYEVRNTICRECRHKLAGGLGRYTGEYTHHSTYELRNPLCSLEALPEGYELERLARQYKVELPPEMKYDGRLSWHPTITLDNKEI